jgi:hypothetical protein
MSISALFSHYEVHSPGTFLKSVLYCPGASNTWLARLWTLLGHIDCTYRAVAHPLGNREARPNSWKCNRIQYAGQCSKPILFGPLIRRRELRFRFKTVMSIANSKTVSKTQLKYSLAESLGRWVSSSRRALSHGDVAQSTWIMNILPSSSGGKSPLMLKNVQKAHKC